MSPCKNLLRDPSGVPAPSRPTSPTRASFSSSNRCFRRLISSSTSALTLRSIRGAASVLRSSRGHPVLVFWHCRCSLGPRERGRPCLAVGTCSDCRRKVRAARSVAKKAPCFLVSSSQAFHRWALAGSKLDLQMTGRWSDVSCVCAVASDHFPCASCFSSLGISSAHAVVHSGAWASKPQSLPSFGSSPQQVTSGLLVQLSFPTSLHSFSSLPRR